jgi:hypothetical protein
MPRTTSLLALAGFLCAAPILSAQSAHWEPPGGSLPVGESQTLQLVFEDCSPEDVPPPPKVDGLRMEYQGQSSSFVLNNGSFSRSVSLSYGVLLSNPQGVDIPELPVKTNKGTIRVPATHFAAAGATVGSTGISIDEAAEAKLAPNPTSVWAGQIFDLRYQIDVATGYYPNWGRGAFEWDASPLVIEDWSQPEPFETHNGAGRTGLAYHTRGIAPKPGEIRLNPTNQLISLSVGVAGFGFFQQRQYQQFAVPGKSAPLEVRALPPAPSGFSGAVGEFKISSKVVPLEVKAGEPITWTVELSGSGNWPEIRGLPSREAPGDFQVVQPKPKRTQPTGKLFEGTLAEDVVLVPTKAGSYTLPPLDFTYFDPKSGSYRTVSAPGASLTVDPAPSAAATPGAVAPAAGAPAISLSTPATEAKPPEPPAGSLGDPLAPSAPAPAPIRKRTLAAALATPFVLLSILWAGLALARARATDPLRAQREARRRLAVTLQALRDAPASGKAALLIAWQHDSAILWGVAHAAPPATALGDAAWATLWTEADRFLYGTEAVLPPDWSARAQAAFAAKTLRAFSPARLLLPKNLFPMVLLSLAASGLMRAGPAEAYRSGDFAGAEKSWHDQVAADPLDWSARHNLSLALAQQDRWGEAAAQAAAAFVQNPSNPATARELIVTGDKAGFVPDPLDVLVKQGPLASLARLESPGGWQRVGIGAGALIAASLALLLIAAYRTGRQAWLRSPAFVFFGVGVVAGVASIVAYRAYGITADSRAVVVWGAGTLRSIPTEADTSQKTTTLPAGSTGIADKAFLGWIRLSFPNGESGWILRKEATYLWQAPPE